jgi:hypothetical protein
MTVAFKNRLLLFFLICCFVVLPAAQCRGEIIVYDRVTKVGTPVYLKVLTKGKIFADGEKFNRG